MICETPYKFQLPVDPSGDVNVCKERNYKKKTL